MLCYCSLAKPDPHTKSKTLVSQARRGIVFMHGQNGMANINARSQSQMLEKVATLDLHIWPLRCMR